MFPLPKIPQSSQKNKQTNTVYKGLPCFNLNEFNKNKPTLIGSGGFGKVYLGTHKKELVVAKVLKGVAKEALLKEARFHYRLRHNNLVGFKAICPSGKALMLEYVCFDLQPFGVDRKVSGLDDLLDELNKFKFKGFEHLVPKISKNIVSGLSYLHAFGIAHRDLKPGNVLVALGIKPKSDPDYDILRATEWVNVNEAFHRCIEKGPVKRVTVDTAFQILQEYEASESYPLKIHQGSALIESQENHICAGTDDAIDFQRPKNDGSNACAFLSLKVTESILLDKDRVPSERKNVVEKIIDRFPVKIEKHRNIDERYTVEDAYDILHAGKLLSPCELMKLSSDHVAFSEEGKTELSATMEVEGNVCVVTVPDFTFAVANLSKKILVIDTHVIPESLGGNGNGVIKVFDSSKSCCRWIWKRLHSSGVTDQRQCIHSLQLVNGKLDSQDPSSTEKKTTLQRDDVLVISDDDRDEVMHISEGCMDERDKVMHTSEGCMDDRDKVMHTSEGCIDDRDKVMHTSEGCMDDRDKVMHTSEGCMDDRDKVMHTSEGCMNDRDKVMHTSEGYMDDRDKVMHTSEGCMDDRDKVMHTSEGCMDDRDKVMHTSEGCMNDEKNEKSPTAGEPTNEGANIHAPISIERQNFLRASSGEKQKIEYWGPMKIPFISGIKRKLSNAEVYALTTSDVQRAARIPQACRRNSIFAIDSRTIGDPENVKSDLNGTFTKCIEAKKYIVVVSTNSDGYCTVKAVAKKALNLEEDKIYMSINRRENKFGLIRSITYFCDSKGTVVNDKIILQYFVNRQICGDVDQVEYAVEAHVEAQGGRIGVKQLIEEALKPLCPQIVNLPSKDFIQEAIKDVSDAFMKRISEQETKITYLEERIEVLESKLAVLDRLESRIDDGEQYSRWHCLRIHGMELPPVGSKENCFQKTKKVIEKLNCGVGADAIDRAHRIGSVTENDQGKKFQQIIVRFKSFKDRTSKTTLDKIEKRLLDEKNKAGTIYKELNGEQARPDFGDLPRSKRQIIKKACSLGVSNQSTPAFEVEAILVYDNELEGNGIIWSHNDIPNDMWVLGTKRMADSLKIAATAYPISIDPTFNHGAYEVTPVTYRHPFIEAKSKNVVGKWSDAVMIGPTILHHEKTEDAFDCGIRPIARKAGLMDAKFGFITDGEMALINACKTNFLKAKDLRCMIHFKENCKKFLKSIGICGERKQAPLLDIVFGVGGLVESEDRKDLERRLKEAQQVIVEIQKELLGDSENEQSFFKYLKEHEKTVLRKLMKKRRIKVGMKVDDSGTPERVYSNQSETTNSILSSRKLALGYSKKDDMPKGQFIIKVWRAVVNEQCEEIGRALHGQSEQFRLKEEAKYLQVTTEDWYNWTKGKQDR
eukprot:Seg4881.2 transcript_id=Seg4881.2/GoldUCD/mRNA.D3Y31 product="Serine/threonine-protein kinase TAO3" protein_id=Seg4881.2/GoldUCD/D3Y31